MSETQKKLFENKLVNSSSDLIIDLFTLTYSELKN